MTRSRLPGITGILRYALALLPLLAPALGHAQDETPTLDSGDTAWMLTSTVLVLFMTIPGLALFYGGMVRSKNVLSVLMQCFAVTGLMTVLWTRATPETRDAATSIAAEAAGLPKGVVTYPTPTSSTYVAPRTSGGR